MEAHFLIATALIGFAVGLVTGVLAACWILSIGDSVRKGEWN